MQYNGPAGRLSFRAGMCNEALQPDRPLPITATMITDVLNLRQGRANGCVSHPIACDILESLREMFAYADVGPERGSLEADLTIQAAALAASSGAAAIARTAGPVAAACRAAAEAVEHRQ